MCAKWYIKTGQVKGLPPQTTYTSDCKFHQQNTQQNTLCIYNGTSPVSCHHKTFGCYKYVQQIQK